MTKPELDATPEFDCLMVCLLLTLSWDERLLKKLFRKFGLQQENPRFDPAFALYRLHHEFHDPDSPIAANLLRRFSREFRRETARIRGLPDDDNATAPLAITTTLMNESPAGTLWALAGDGRLNLRSLATYHAHRLLLEAFHPATGAFFCASRLREQCAAQEQMLREQRTTLAEQNQRITTLEQENRQLQQALTEAETRRRELRMLRYAGYLYHSGGKRSRMSLSTRGLPPPGRGGKLHAGQCKGRTGRRPGPPGATIPIRFCLPGSGTGFLSPRSLRKWRRTATACRRRSRGCGGFHHPRQQP